MPCTFMILLFATAAAAGSTVPAQLDAILKDYDRADAPGASVLVAQDGKVLYHRAFGLANLEERTPITTATNFRLASVTKQFTATAVLLLAERGKMSLDDPLTRFFPGFAKAAHGVKVRHLLGHTSGLLDYEELIPPGATVPLKDKDVLDLVGKQDRLYFAPGSQFRYSNTGYALLALIVEKVSGRSFAQFLEANIFGPLGMAGTVAYEEGISKVERRAYGYSERDGRFERTDQSLTSSVLGDGGIYSSVEDLWLWDQALYGTRLLPAETLAMAFKAGTSTSDQPGSGYGYGWYVASHRGTRKVWHYGETIGFSTYLARYPDKRLTIIMLTNRNDNFLGPTVDRIADVVLAND
ncbi:MAG TPA: serine hydrolase domain-containing protein [Thermoanaerobaculia bacterium]|nr:serine hydrolase domain-containing protein [Thermoanaerobaculia bacterium]